MRGRCQNTVAPRYNEIPYNEILAITKPTLGSPLFYMANNEIFPTTNSLDSALKIRYIQTMVPKRLPISNEQKTALQAYRRNSLHPVNQKHLQQ